MENVDTTAKKSKKAPLENADTAATTIAAVLLILFLQQGAPLILQSDNGKEFVAKIIGELMKLWSDC
jgi:hypothetical protein